MDKESLLKAREFILNIDKIDMPLIDKTEILQNLYTYLTPENYEKHTKTLIMQHNQELKYKSIKE